MKKVTIGTICLVLFMGLFVFAQEDEEYAKFEVNGDLAIMTGVINSKTPKDVETLVKEYPNLKTIVMKDVPGSMDDVANLEASRIIRKYGLNTHVPKDGMVASGGTDFFCAGVNRTIEEGARIGVHSWAGDGIFDASKLAKDNEEHKKYIDYYKEMGIPTDFYWFTINAAPANDMHFMKKEELKKYKLIDSIKGEVKNPNYQKYISAKDIIRDTSKLDKVYKKYYSKYINYIAPNGKPIMIVAQDKVSDEQLLKAYNVLSFYLQDFGMYKKGIVANKIADNNAVLVMPNGADGESDIPENALEGQPLYQMEVPTIGSKWYIENDYEHRDAAYEEIFHMVHDYGIGIQSNMGALPNLQKEIYKAMRSSLPKDKKYWGKKGIWGLDSKNWLIELEEEGSLEQEYIVSVIDSYYGLWAPYKEGKGGMWGVYTSKTREEIKKNDPLGYNIITKFLPENLMYMARVEADFTGTFKMYYDKKSPYTHKSKYLQNVRLLGSKNTNLVGNQLNNILIGNQGNNNIDGREGFDTVQFLGKSDDYKIEVKNGKLFVEDKLNGEGKDFLSNIELLRFTDKDIRVSDLDN